MYKHKTHMHTLNKIKLSDLRMHKNKKKRFRGLTGERTIAI